MRNGKELVKMEDIRTEQYPSKPHLKNILKFKYSIKKNTYIPQVLLIEDNPIIKKVNMEFLEKLGCHVEFAESGLQALAMCHDTYDLILLDIKLPDISGFDLSKAIRKIPSKANIPIVAITTVENLKNEHLLAGINDLITKPALPGQLKKVLIKWGLNLKDF